MVILADEVLESFFETDLSGSFRLEFLPDFELPLANGGLLGDIWSTIATNENKKIFHKVTDGIGKTIGKHQVGHLTSLSWAFLNTEFYTGYSSTIHWSVYNAEGASSSRISPHTIDAQFTLQV